MISQLLRAVLVHQTEKSFSGKRAACGTGGYPAVLNCDGIMLVRFIESLTQSPGAITFTVSHDYWKWTDGRGGQSGYVWS